MSVIRVEKNKNYTTMSNYHLKEKDMSLKAKGLMSMMLSLPEDWDYSIAGLVAICKENETAIKTTLDELKEFGYLKVIKKMPNETESGRIEYEYILYEEKQDIEKQDLENLGVEILGVENQGQLNTNNKITNKLNTNNKERVRFTPPTLDEVIEYAREKNRLDIAENFYNYFEEGKWTDSKGNKVKNWKQKFLTWCSYGKKETKEESQIERAYKRLVSDE